ncbi:MAG: RNA polymerase sigma factor [Chloroflexota bacterium]
MPLERLQLEDGVLVERARRGDVVAYEALVQRYQELAFRTAYLITTDASEAEDAAQDAFVKAYYNLGRFRAGAPFRPWLLRIVANESRNRRTATGRRASLALRAADAGHGASAETSASPEALALLQEQRDSLIRAVADLREDDRLVIAYRYFFELTEHEMAAALACPRGTVKSRLSRALERLRAGYARHAAPDAPGEGARTPHSIPEALPRAPAAPSGPAKEPADG